MKCVGGPTSQGCLFIRKCTRFDLDTTIVYSVLSFEFLGFGEWVGGKKEGAGGDSQTIVKCDCGRTLKGKEYKDILS